jgi:AraC-like DNA-binding protein
MYDQIRGNTIFIMLYAVVTAMTMIASCYLLFRQGNAFARDVKPPLRLRRWTAAYFAAAALCHLWYMPIFFLTSSEDIMMTDLVGGLLDSMTVFPLVIIVMLNMLQDRRRPLWPIALMIAPFVVGGIFSVATLSYDLIPMLYVYLLLLSVGIVIYMVRATRQYGRWLRDNYADLEHKEVWQSFVILAFILLVIVFYAFVSEGPLFQYAIQVIGIILVVYLLWRVETLSELSIPANDAEEDALPLSTRNSIGLLLQQHCIDKQLYLQHDLTQQQLATAIGTNRFYLSQYFSSMGMNYNAYINDLRINHFISHYREAVAAQRSFTIQQLAQESGFCSYSTFSNAFKHKTGQSVRAWMKALI